MKSFKNILSAYLFFFTLNLFFSYDVYAQVGSQNAYGSPGLDKCNDITSTSKGGAVIAGETQNSNGSRSTIITRTDNIGTIIWSKIYDNGVFEMPNSILKTEDGGFVIAGERYPKIGQKELAYIFKVNSSGDQLWARIYDSGGNMAEALAANKTNDGGFIITGRAEKTLMTTNAFLPITSEIRYLYLLKISADGNPVWSKKYNSGQKVRLTRGNDVFPSKNGGYVIAGEFQHNSPSRKDLDMGILKVSSNGDVEWAKQIGGVKADAGSEIIQTLDGGYLLCGETESYGVGNLDICLVKTDIDGNLLWSKTYGNKGFDQVGDLVERKDGNIVIVGKTTYSNEDVNALILILDSKGNIIHSNSFGGTRLENGVSINVTDQGLLMGANTMSNGAGQMDILLLNLDIDGRSNCNSTKTNINELMFTPKVSDMTLNVKVELVDENTVIKTEGQGQTKVNDSNFIQNTICE